MVEVNLACPLPLRVTPAWGQTHGSLGAAARPADFNVTFSQPTCAVLLYFTIHLKSVVVHGVVEGKPSQVHSQRSTTTFIRLQYNKGLYYCPPTLVDIHKSQIIIKKFSLSPLTSSSNLLQWSSLFSRNQ